jgi:hypothetical protein
MRKKKPILKLEHPSPSIDMRIIANERLRILQAIGGVPPGQQCFKIEPFRCYARGYVLQDGIILMFDPQLFDVRSSVLTVKDCEPPFEVWILHDDKVADYFELGGEDAG